MGKASPPSIKYLVRAKFTTKGVVEKPDVIGAVFGQTEGLLGEELELRQLQKEGKIGRIDAEMSVSGEGETTETHGVVTIPTSIDKAETTLIAAAVETIDRIGPCDAKFEIESIDDVRSSKRDFIMERAKALMEKLSSQVPEMREIKQNVIDTTKTAKLVEFGDEKLAAGPDVEKSNEIIVVEGRADVVNLLRCNIKNAVAMNGTKLPKSIIELTKEKEATLFVDGDRGGILIAKDVFANANIRYVARAPDGKEVEELLEKEVIACLRNRMSIDEFRERYMRERTERSSGGYQERQGYRQERPRNMDRGRMQSRGYGNNYERRERIERAPIKEEPFEPIKLTATDKKEIEKQAKTIDGKRKALLLNKEGKKLEVLEMVSVQETVNALYQSKRRGKKIDVLIIDGTATPQLIITAERLNLTAIAAKNFTSTSEKVKMISV